MLCVHKIPLMYGFLAIEKAGLPPALTINDVSQAF